MAHSHVHAGTGDRPDDDSGPGPQIRSDRRQSAIHVMVVILIPIAIWTMIALIVMWPDDISTHIRKDVSTASAEGLTLPEGRVTAIAVSSCDGMEGSVPDDSSTCATLSVQVDEGPEQGQTFDVPIQAARYASGVEIGTQVVLYRVPGVDGIPNYSFAEFERGTPLLVITLIFVAAVVAVARLRGLLALVGLGFAAFILVKFMFPALVAGANPILVGLVGGSAIMFVVLYAAHGFSARTTTALIGTLFGLGLSAGFGWIATRWAHLTGVTGEDDYVLSATAPDLKLVSVVVCATIVAGLGVLNDVTITQASAVWELADGSDDHSRLFSRAMRIGRDHIASTVYTIAFATAGGLAGHPAADLDLRPSGDRDDPGRAVRHRDHPNAGRLDRPRAGRPADHRDRRRRGQGVHRPVRSNDRCRVDQGRDHTPRRPSATTQVDRGLFRADEED